MRMQDFAAFEPGYEAAGRVDRYWGVEDAVGERERAGGDGTGGVEDGGVEEVPEGGCVPG